MPNKINKLFSVFLAAALVCCAVFSASALTEDAFEKQYSATKAHLQTLTPQVGSIGGEWLVLGLTRAGAFDESAQAQYFENACAYVQSAGSNRLHRSKSSDNSRVILALSAIGKDARNVGGYDLTAPLNDIPYVSKQGINGVIWALIALDSCDYPCESGVREQLLDRLLAAQHSDGGWGLDDVLSDPDVTGMAIQALAPYRFYDEAVKAALERAVVCLVSMQKSGGGYASYDDFNPESCAQVLVALSCLQIDVQRDARFATLLDSLLQFTVDGGFAHTVGLGYNQMATEQAFYAMTAYKRLLADKTTLYDMTDVQSFAMPDADGDGAATINDATMLQRFIAEFSVSLSAPQQRLADSSRNGKIDINDVTMLQRMLAQ